FVHRHRSHLPALIRQSSDGRNPSDVTGPARLGRATVPGAPTRSSAGESQLAEPARSITELVLRASEYRWRRATGQARMKNPAMIVPGAMSALHALNKCAEQGVPAQTLGLVQLRASQINGCSVCVDMHSRSMKKAGETDERLFAVAAWREAPYFTEAER